MPKRVVCGCLVLGLVLVLAGGVRADDEKEAKPPPTWQELAAVEGMTPEDIERLGTQKVLIGVRTFPQIFSAYAQHDQVPAFVTSDTVLRAYNVLLERSLSVAERARALEMPRVLLSIWKRLAPQIPKGLATTEVRDVARAVRRARITIGTALVLLESDLPDAGSNVREAIEEEAGLVRAGAGRRRPPWMGESDEPLDTLDYERFRPRGLYVQSALLQRYYRAVAWLQDVPFHASRIEDRRVIGVIRNAFGKGRDRPDELWEAEEACRRFVRRYHRFLGEGGDPSIFETKGRSRRGDDESGDVVFHVLPRIETPDGTYLRGLFDERARRGQGRPMPGGADMVKALRNPSAWHDLQKGDDLFRRYMRSLALLVDAPEPEAPPLFGGEAWDRKARNTVLGAWAQIRHAWALAAMDSQTYFGGVDLPPGWVEPDPAFFATMRALATDTERELRHAGAFTGQAGISEELEALHWFVETIARLDSDGVLAKGHEGVRDALAEWERVRASELWMQLYWRAVSRFRTARRESDRGDVALSDSERTAGLYRVMAQMAQEYIDRFEKIRNDDPSWRKRYADPLDLQGRWEALQKILGRLESLASKQLRGVPLDDADAAFFRSYGKTLAYAMLQDGDAYLEPARDRPLVTPMLSVYPQTAVPRSDERARILHAGIGMPVAIYVLWPHEGKEVLCRGGVMPYYETVESTRLTDEAWAERLRSDDAPRPPDWVQPITAPIRPRPKRQPR